MTYYDLNAFRIAGEVVKAMPGGASSTELARERGVGVERHRNGPIEILVAQGSDGSGGGRAVAPEQIESRLFPNPRIHAIVARGLFLPDGSRLAIP